MLDTFRYAGEWLIVNISALKVSDFIGWRRVKGSRRFQPFIQLDTGEHQIFFDGYEKVWIFLDSLFADLYKPIVNSSMKGDIEGIMFHRELPELIRETDKEFLCMRFKETNKLIPNDNKTVKGYDILEVHACSSSFSEWKAHPLYLGSLRLPYTGREGTQFFDTAILGLFPQMCLVSEEGVVQTICYNSRGRDLRPHRMTKTQDRHVIEDLIRLVSNQEFCDVGGANLNRMGMRLVERDGLENHFFLEFQQNSERNKRKTESLLR